MGGVGAEMGSWMGGQGLEGMEVHLPSGVEREESKNLIATFVSSVFLEAAIIPGLSSPCDMPPHSL